MLVNRWEGPRYAYAPAALLIEAALVGVAVLAAVPWTGDGPVAAAATGMAPPMAPSRDGRRLPWLRTVPLIAVVAVVSIEAAASYRLESRASTGPDYEAEFRTAIAACRNGGAGSVRVPISPTAQDRTWTVEVPCARAR